MKNTFLFLMFLSFTSTVAYSQQVQRIPAPAKENWKIDTKECDEIEPARQKVENCTDQYLQDLDEYKKGFFCSDCERTKRQIEKEMNISFTQHIDDGKGHGRVAKSATQEMYNKLYLNYKTGWDALYKQYQNQIKACTETRIKLVEQGNEERKRLAGTFNTSYTGTESKILAVSKSNPTEASKLKNRALSVHNQFQAELNKKSQANTQKLQEFTAQLQQIDKELNLLNDVVERQAGTKQQQTANNTTTSNTNNSNKPITINQPNIVNTNSNTVAENQRKAIMDKLDSDLQKNQNTYNVVTTGVKDMGTILGNYLASKERDKEVQKIYHDKKNLTAYNLIQCRKQIGFDRCFNKIYHWSSCDLIGDNPGKIFDWDVKNGIRDSVYYYNTHKNYLRATQLLYNMEDRDISNKDYNLLKCGKSFDDMKYVFIGTWYSLDWFKDEKEQNKFEKDLAKNKVSDWTIIQRGVTALLDKKDTIYATFCFNTILNKSTTTPYLIKQSLLYKGLIKKSQGIDKMDINLLNESYQLLNKAFLINQTEFLKNPPTEISYSSLGMYFFPEYFILVQLAILQEVTHCMYYQYKITHDQKYLINAQSYYYNFFESIN